MDAVPQIEWEFMKDKAVPGQIYLLICQKRLKNPEILAGLYRYETNRSQPVFTSLCGDELVPRHSVMYFAHVPIGEI